MTSRLRKQVYITQYRRFKDVQSGHAHLHGGGRGFLGEQVANEAGQVVLGGRQERIQLRTLWRWLLEVLQHHQHLNKDMSSW